MNKYYSEEFVKKYKVIVYSENQIFIRKTEEILRKKDIDVVSRSINKKTGSSLQHYIKNGLGSSSCNPSHTLRRTFDQGKQNDCDNEYFKVIIDLDCYGIKTVKDLKEIDNLSNNLILLTSIKLNYKQYNLVFKNSIVMSKTKNIEHIRATAESIGNIIFNQIPQIIEPDLIQRTQGKSIKNIIVSLVIVALVFPYTLMVISAFKNVILGSGVFRNTSVRTQKNIFFVEVQNNIFLCDLIKSYGKIPFFGKIYIFPTTYCTNYLRSVQIKHQTLDYLFEIYRFVLGLKTGGNMISMKGGLLTNNKYLYTEGNFITGFHLNEYITLINQIDNISQQFWKTEFVNNDTLVVIRSSNKILYPTGGGFESLTIHSYKDGTYKKVGDLTKENIGKHFKGSFPDIASISNFHDHRLINTALNFSDKQYIIETISKEVFGVVPKYYIFIDNDFDDALNRKTDNDYQNKNLEYFKNINKDILDLIQNKSIILLKTPDTGTNILNKIGEINVGKCKHPEIMISEIITNNNGVEKSGITIDMFEKSDTYNVSIGYIPSTKQNNKTGLLLGYSGRSSFSEIKSSDKWNNIKTQNGEYFLIPTITGRYLMNVVFNKEACGEGFGIDLIKQPGNNRLSYEYVINSYEVGYFYINGFLTGKGNRFYNSQLTKLSEDLFFRFIRI